MNDAPLLSLILPLPPSTNKVWTPGRKKGRDGHGYNGMRSTTAVMDYRQVVAAIVMEQGHPGMIRCQLTAKVSLVPKTRATIDHDNRGKALWDALEACGVLENDKQIRRCVYDAHWEPITGGECGVVLWRLDSVPEVWRR